MERRHAMALRRWRCHAVTSLGSSSMWKLGSRVASKRQCRLAAVELWLPAQWLPQAVTPLLLVMSRAPVTQDLLEVDRCGDCSGHQLRRGTAFRQTKAMRWFERPISRQTTGSSCACRESKTMMWFTRPKVYNATV